MAKPDIKQLFSGVSKDARAEITDLAVPIIRDMQESHRLWQELQEVRQGMDDLRAGAPGTPQPPRAVLAGSLKEIREAVGFSQAEVARRYGVPQPVFSRTERAQDMLIFTLRDHIKALGGSLKLVVDFANEKSVTVGVKPEASPDLPRREHRKALSIPAPEEAEPLDTMIKRLLPQDQEKLAALVEIIAEQKKTLEGRRQALESERARHKEMWNKSAGQSPTSSPSTDTAFMTFTELRVSRGMTKTAVAERAGFEQKNMKSIEDGKNTKLSTLYTWAEGMGGALRLVAEFPHRPAMDITSLRVPLDQRDHVKRANNPRFHKKKQKTGLER